MLQTALYVLVVWSGDMTLAHSNAETSRRLTYTTQLARNKESESEDDDYGLERPASRSAGSRSGKELRSPSGGYDPERIRNFWKHYHGTRTRKAKAKPLEHER